MMYTGAWLLQVLYAWWTGYATRREWLRALRLPAYGPEGTDTLKRWYAGGKRCMV